MRYPWPNEYQCAVALTFDVDAEPALVFRDAGHELGAYGFNYDSALMGDDIAYELETPGGPRVEVPVQWLVLEQLIRHMRDAPGVWFATVGEIAAWAASRRA